MDKGTVKWFDNKKGYGFIATDNGQDVFCHFSAVKEDGYKTLEEGQPVELIIEQDEKGPRAKEVFKVGVAEEVAQ